MSSDLETIVLACLAKKKEDRPSGAAAMCEALQACAEAGKWTRSMAEEWWSEHRAQVARTAPEPAAGSTKVLEKTIGWDDDAGYRM